MKKSKKVALIEHKYFDDLLKLAIADLNGSKGNINSTGIYEFITEYNQEKHNRPELKEKLINGFDVINLE